MKIIPYKYILSSALVSLTILTPLYSQNLFLQEPQAPLVFDVSSLFAQKSRETTTHKIYEIGTILKSFVDPRSDGYSGFL